MKTKKYNLEIGTWQILIDNPDHIFPVERILTSEFSGVSIYGSSHQTSVLTDGYANTFLVGEQEVHLEANQFNIANGFEISCRDEELSEQLVQALSKVLG